MDIQNCAALGFISRHHCYEDRFSDETNFHHLVSGLPPDKKEFFKSAKTEISYQQNGDEWEIHVGMQGVPNHRTFRFKLGEPYVSADLDGSPMKVSSRIFAYLNFKQKYKVFHKFSYH